jgi:hypothetical protein
MFNQPNFTGTAQKRFHLTDQQIGHQLIGQQVTDLNPKRPTNHMDEVRHGVSGHRSDLV